MTAPLYASEQYVKHFFTTDSSIPARPTSWVVALHTGDPNKGSDNEVVGYNYVRQAVTFTATEAATNFEASNDADVTFPSFDTGANFTITHYTIRDGVSGSALATGKLAIPIQVSTGTNVVFPAGYILVRGV